MSACDAAYAEPTASGGKTTAIPTNRHKLKAIFVLAFPESSVQAVACPVTSTAKKLHRAAKPAARPLNTLRPMPENRPASHL
jgi:hypothetical protein